MDLLRLLGRLILVPVGFIFALLAAGLFVAFGLANLDIHLNGGNFDFFGHVFCLSQALSGDDLRITFSRVFIDTWNRIIGFRFLDPDPAVARMPALV